MQHPAFEEVTFHPDHSDEVSFKKKIIKTTIILSIITLIELGLGLLIHALHLPDNLGRLLIKGVIIILSLAKVFYIVSVFMHLGDEVRALIMSIVVPALLFVWFLTAFMFDGHSFKVLRNKFDRHFKESVTPEKPAQPTSPATHELKPGVRS